MAQTHQCVLKSGNNTGGRVDYTPSGADVAAGEVVELGKLFAFAPNPIKDGELGTLLTAVSGLTVKIVKKNGAISQGDKLYWDADGDPQGGTAGTGAAEGTATIGNLTLGWAAAAAGATDETVDCLLAPDYDEP